MTYSTACMAGAVYTVKYTYYRDMAIARFCLQTQKLTLIMLAIADYSCGYGKKSIIFNIRLSLIGEMVNQLINFANTCALPNIVRYICIKM